MVYRTLWRCDTLVNGGALFALDEHFGAHGGKATCLAALSAKGHGGRSGTVGRLGRLGGGGGGGKRKIAERRLGCQRVGAVVEGRRRRRRDRNEFVGRATAQLLALLLHHTHAQRPVLVFVGLRRVRQRAGAVADTPFGHSHFGGRCWRRRQVGERSRTKHDIIPIGCLGCHELSDRGNLGKAQIGIGRQIASHRLSVRLNRNAH